MPAFSDVLEEIRVVGGAADVVRRKYLRALSDLTGRNTIIYYSGWLQKTELTRQGFSGFEVNDSDKNGLMSAIHRLDRSKGLDLVLHTPGGEMAATESIVDYLRSMFGRNVRAIVPQLAMSAGTMISLSCREIVMGKHSSLGPIDPQISGIAAHGVIEEFAQAVTETQSNPASIHMWQPIIAKYPPTFIGECQKAITLANDMVQKWLETGMFARDPDRTAKAQRIVAELGDHQLTKSHARHISIDAVRKLEIRVRALERDQKLQDAVLSLHHAAVLTLQQSAAVKIIENQNGVAFIQSVQVA